MKRVLDRIGLGQERVNLYECGAAEFNRFLESVSDTMGNLQKIGPSPLKK